MLLLLLSGLDWWHWLLLAMVLAIIEMIVPSFYFLWLAAAAVVVSVVVAIFPAIHWETQLLLFGALSISTLLVHWLLFRNLRPAPSDQPGLNRRGEQYAGRVLVLVEPIENGYGAVRVDDTRWRVTGPAAAVGEPVRVVGMEGMTLRVEALEQPTEPDDS